VARKTIPLQITWYYSNVTLYVTSITLHEPISYKCKRFSVLDHPVGIHQMVMRYGVQKCYCAATLQCISKQVSQLVECVVLTISNMLKLIKIKMRV